MARETYVIRDGKLVPRHLAGPPPSAGRRFGNGPMLMRDYAAYDCPRSPGARSTAGASTPRTWRATAAASLSRARAATRCAGRRSKISRRPHERIVDKALAKAAAEIDA
jgi:hypothetical protein